MVRVKICGLTNLEDALAAAELGADALGFVFAPSPRRVTPEQVRQIVAQLPPFLVKVGVFRDSELDRVQDIMSSCHLDLAQLHGSETPEYCQALWPKVIKAFRVEDASFLSQMPHYRVAAYLLDGPKPGSGQGFDWGLARQAARQGRVILSGGLTPDNVRQAIETVRPYGVDVSSGVESRPGRKDHHKLGAFIRAAKGG
ncbi:MAG TPA: phosphoribosylanthranilate isomerase [Dehalococcoidia bacterium]|jgi:phosphoribosylanthranilate isomerase|nr:phosphoribosylanthranilate isomerase [Dehalococcoidia bacterium]